MGVVARDGLVALGGGALGGNHGAWGYRGATRTAGMDSRVGVPCRYRPRSGFRRHDADDRRCSGQGPPRPSRPPRQGRRLVEAHRPGGTRLRREH